MIKKTKPCDKTKLEHRAFMMVVSTGSTTKDPETSSRLRHSELVSESFRILQQLHRLDMCRRCTCELCRSAKPLQEP